MHDLNGLKVYHVEKGLVENKQAVLTLKDTTFVMDVDDKTKIMKTSTECRCMTPEGKETSAKR